MYTGVPEYYEAAFFRRFPMPKGLCAFLAAALMLTALPARAETTDLFLWKGMTPEKLGTNIGQDGADVIRVDTKWPTTINIAEIDLKNAHIEDTALKYTAQMKEEGLDGTAYLEMWVHFPGAKGGIYFSRGLDNQLSKE